MRNLRAQTSPALVVAIFAGLIAIGLLLAALGE
jgi:hypothetical protein